MPDIIIPPRKKPNNDNGYFEILTKAVFQAGFSWKVVESKWGGFNEIFKNFDPDFIANWKENDVINALESPFIIRNEKKIKATIENAKVFIRIKKQYGSFDNYLQTINVNSYEELSSILIKQFKWLGRTGAYFFLWCIGEEVPKWENR